MLFALVARMPSQQRGQGWEHQGTATKAHPVHSLHDLSGARRLSLKLHVPCLLFEGAVCGSLSGLSI